MGKIAKTYKNLKRSKRRIHIEQGGAASGKTYSILQYLIELAYINRNSAPALVSVARKTLPALKKSVHRDFINILKNTDIKYTENRSSLTYRLWNTTIEFFSLDDPQKARGGRRDILYLNEANEFDYEDFLQLNMRTQATSPGNQSKVIIDFNPSEEFWAHTEITDCERHITTYRDNPFLDPVVRTELEKLRDLDENMWRVYGLGQLGIIEGLVFPRWTPFTEMPRMVDWTVFGIDFGFSNDPTAVIRVDCVGEHLYLTEVLYSTECTASDIATQLRGLEHFEFVADNMPMAIEDLTRLGFTVYPAKKPPGSILTGVDRLKGYRLHVNEASTNLLHEFRHYKYKTDRNGKKTIHPVDAHNHGIDAIRYAVSSTHAERVYVL